MSVRTSSRAHPADALGALPAAVERVARSSREGACWTVASDDWDVNLVAWARGHGVAAHVNEAVDVIVIGIRGRGEIELDGRPIPLRSRGIHLIPRGARRSIRAETRLLYLTCHPRRARTFSNDELLGPRTG